MFVGLILPGEPEHERACEHANERTGGLRACTHIGEPETSVGQPQVLTAPVASWRVPARRAWRRGTVVAAKSPARPRLAVTHHVSLFDPIWLWPHLANIGPSLVNFGLMLAKAGCKKMARFVRSWSDSGHSGQKRARYRPILGRVWAESGPNWSNSEQRRSNLG